MLQGMPSRRCCNVDFLGGMLSFILSFSLAPRNAAGRAFSAVIELLLDLKFSNLLRNRNTLHIGPELRHRSSGDILNRSVYRQLTCSARPSSNFSSRAFQRFERQRILNKVGWQGMDWVLLAQDRDQLSGSCDHGNEPPGSTKGGELSDCHLLKECSYGTQLNLN
jgi:hypothetical protein